MMKSYMDNFGNMFKSYFQHFKPIELELMRNELFKRLSYTELAEADFDGHSQMLAILKNLSLAGSSIITLARALSWELPVTNQRKL